LALKVALSVLAPTWAYYFPLARADAIVWGILVAAVDRADVMPPNAAVAGNRGAVAVVGVAGVVWFLGPVAFAVGGWALQFPVVDTAAAVGAAALVWLGRRAGGGGGFGGALDVTIRWCGWRCYGIYLLHAPALSLVETVGGVLAATVATAAAAELSWRWLESPILATEAACR
jgi:peptidoglycan/LPS O-acetylase OafA/YrhL